MNNYQKLVQSTEHCTEQIRLMIPMEKEKRSAIISDDMASLQQILFSQQAAVMKLENLENQRLVCQRELGLEGLSADEVIAKVPEEVKQQLIVCFEDLREAATELKEFNAKALELAKASVQFWDSLENKKTSTIDKVTYRPNGQKPSEWKRSSSFETKI